MNCTLSTEEEEKGFKYCYYVVFVVSLNMEESWSFRTCSVVLLLKEAILWLVSTQVGSSGY